MLHLKYSVRFKDQICRKLDIKYVANLKSNKLKGWHDLDVHIPHALPDIQGCMVHLPRREVTLAHEQTKSSLGCIKHIS